MWKNVRCVYVCVCHDASFVLTACKNWKNSKRNSAAKISRAKAGNQQPPKSAADTHPLARALARTHHEALVGEEPDGRPIAPHPRQELLPTCPLIFSAFVVRKFWQRWKDFTWKSQSPAVEMMGIATHFFGQICRVSLVGSALILISESFRDTFMQILLTGE